jgi:hypothetical protein
MNKRELYEANMNLQLEDAKQDASSAWQEYHKMKEELASTKCKLGQSEDYINEVLKPELADTKLKLKMAQSAWDELDKSHAARAKLHDELIIAEGQRDQARAERDALRTEAIMARIRGGPSPAAGFTAAGIARLAAAEADGHAFAGDRK